MGSDAWIVIGSVGGAFVGALGGFLGAFLSTRSIERQHRQRIAFEAGMREWEQVHNATQDMAKASRGKSFAVAPSFAYVLTSLRILDLVERGDLSPEAVQRFMEERDKLTAQVFADVSRSRRNQE